MTEELVLPYHFPPRSIVYFKAEPLEVRCGHCMKEITLEGIPEGGAIGYVIQVATQCDCPYCGVIMHLPQDWYQVEAGKTLFAIPGSMLHNSLGM